MTDQLTTSCCVLVDLFVTDVSSRLVKSNEVIVTQYLTPFDLVCDVVSFTDTIPQQIWNLKKGET